MVCAPLRDLYSSGNHAYSSYELRQAADSRRCPVPCRIAICTMPILHRLSQRAVRCNSVVLRKGKQGVTESDCSRGCRAQAGTPPTHVMLSHRTIFRNGTFREMDN